MMKQKLKLSIVLCIFSLASIAQSFELYQVFDYGEVLNGLNYYQVGKTISILGDVNGDGYDDWAVALNGAVHYETGQGKGRVNIYFGSGEIFDNKPPDLVIWGNREDLSFGNILKGVGDLNNDGFDDIVVDNQVYFGGDPMDALPDLIINLDIELQYEREVGISAFSDAGDVNNDGYDDLIIGSFSTIGSVYPGLVILYYGGNPMDGGADLVFEGEVDFETGAKGYGGSISAGDFNGDGYDDIIVGTQSTEYSGGAVRLYLGGESMDPEVDYIFEDLGAAGAGSKVSFAGDLNGDGYEDFVTGSYISAEAFIFYGSDDPSLIPAVNMPGAASSYYGFAVAGGSDYNKDGFDDVMVGAFDFGMYNDGVLYIYFGGEEMDSIWDVYYLSPVYGDKLGHAVCAGGDFNADGFGDFLAGSIGDYSSYKKYDDGGNIYIFLGNDSLDNTPAAMYSAPQPYAQFGVSVDSPGDLDGDGYADFLIGAGSLGIDNKSLGEAYIYHGGPDADLIPEKTFRSDFPAVDIYFGARVESAGDLNGDGYTDLAISEASDVWIYFGGDNLDTIADLRIDLGYYNTRSLNSAGDVNNDGFDDLLMGGEYRYDTKPNAVWVYLGGEEMDNNPDMQWEGEDVNDQFGFYTAGDMDLNMDGYADFIIARTGTASVFLGGPELPEQPYLDVSRAGGYFGFGVTGGQDLNGDGYEDFAVGHSLFNTDINDNMHKVLIYFGGETIDDVEDLILPVDSVTQLFPSQPIVYMTPDLDNDEYPDLLITSYAGLLFVKGGPEMDDIPDDTIPGLYNDLAYFMDPSTGEAGIIAGKPTDNSVGFWRGRAYVYKFMEEEEIEDTTGNETFVKNRFAEGDILMQNRPNPFSHSTVITVNLNISTHLKLEVFDVYGKKVGEIGNGFYPAGTFDFEFDRSGLVNGIYFYRMKAGDRVISRKMVVGGGRGG